ncbi:twin-arginine translocase TatA/TatE family subunit [Chloroflexota bacterium]
MGFLGIGTGEILLVLVLALIIWGPGRLPEIARTLGKAVRALRKASFDLTNAVTKEVEKGTGLSTQPGKSPDSKPGESSPDTGDAKAGGVNANPGKPIERQQ